MAGKKKGQQGPLFTVDLELTDPEKTTAGWLFKAIAIAEHRPTRTPPDPTREIEFTIDGISNGVQTTDPGTGRATLPIEVKRARPWKVQAQIVGTSYRSPVRVVPLREEERKEPNKLVGYIRTTEVEVSPGQKLVLFTALDRQDLPVAGATIEVIDKSQTNGRKKLRPTDKSGSTTYKVVFAHGEWERYFEYHCGKFHKSKRVWR